jgi:hypothetical protein
MPLTYNPLKFFIPCVIILVFKVCLLSSLAGCKKKETTVTEGTPTSVTGTKSQILAWCDKNGPPKCVDQSCPDPVECPAPPPPPKYDSRQVRAGEYLIVTKVINAAPKQMATVCGPGRHGRTVWFRAVGKQFVTLFTCDQDFPEVPKHE